MTSSLSVAKLYTAPGNQNRTHSFPTLRHGTDTSPSYFSPILALQDLDLSRQLIVCYTRLCLGHNLLPRHSYKLKFNPSSLCTHYQEQTIFDFNHIIFKTLLCFFLVDFFFLSFLFLVTSRPIQNVFLTPAPHLLFTLSLTISILPAF